MSLSRQAAGWPLSATKPLPGIYARLVWPKAQGASRRAMHAGVFEGVLDSEAPMPGHRAAISGVPRGRGLEAVGPDGAYVPHERGPEIDAAKRTCDHVQGRISRYQTLVTATVAHAERAGGIAAEVPCPHYRAEELAYLNGTAQADYSDRESARRRLVELFHDWKNRWSYRKAAEMAAEVVRQLESGGRFPHARYAFDNGVLSLPLTRLIEQQGKHWVSELERSRLIQWLGQWRRVDAIAADTTRAPSRELSPSHSDLA